MINKINKFLTVQTRTKLLGIRTKSASELNQSLNRAELYLNQGRGVKIKFWLNSD